MEMATAMAADLFQCSSGIEVRDTAFKNLLTLPDTQVRRLRMRLERTDMITGGADFSVTSVQDDDVEIVLAEGKLLADQHGHCNSTYQKGEWIFTEVVKIQPC